MLKFGRSHPWIGPRRGCLPSAFQAAPVPPGANGKLSTMNQPRYLGLLGHLNDTE